ncbi:hypothetical protein VNI00_005440 [Paramarasmius palmivorus]|uniref:HNH nuclease domain-containing protein n=1 Tax=Paramarasmius palmivorus TaxID=297713 RepID=A0AAW0DFA6_9AGAR
MKCKSQPLPQPSDTIQASSKAVQDAYSRVVTAENLSQKAEEKRNSRIIGYLLIWFVKFQHTLSEQPTTYLVEEIHHLPDDRAVFELGEHYLQLFTAFRRYKPTPKPSTRPSRPSPDDQVEDLEHLVGSKKNYKNTKDLALFRDGFRCLATSVLEMQAVLLYNVANDGTASPTQCCHIFGAGNVIDLEANKHERELKRQRASGSLAILKAFGISISDTFIQKDGVHDLRNVLTLRAPCHEAFDAMYMWFEPTGVKHQYKICHFIDGQLARETHDMVTFQINDAVVEGSSPCIEKMKANPDQFLPDPKLLTLHATCAKVAHLSGAAEVLDEWERDLEEKKVLAADGSDMDMFNYALIGLVQVEVN